MVGFVNLKNKGMINIENKILEFIHRRFPTDSNWKSGNCYFFSLILHDVFAGSIFYDIISGHFVTLINGKYYDWTGIVEPDGHLVEWEKFDEYDSLLKQRIIRDCIL